MTHDMHQINDIVKEYSESNTEPVTLVCNTEPVTLVCLYVVNYNVSLGW